MLKIISIFLFTFYLSACCRTIKPTGDNYQLFVEIRKSDNVAVPGQDCDGDIIISNPRGAGVVYEWSHDPKLTGYQADKLCPGMYEITIRAQGKVRTTQVIIN